MTALVAGRVSRWSSPSAVLTLVAAVLPPLGVVAPLGLAPLLVVATLALLVIDWRLALVAVRDFAAIAALLAALSLWGMLSAFWSILPAHSFLEGLRLLAVSAGGLICLASARSLEPSERLRIGGAAALGVVLAAALLITARFIDLELFSAMLKRAPGYPLTRFDRGTTVVALALWPALAGVAARKWLPVVLALAAGVAVLSLVDTAAKLALIVGLAALALGYSWPRLVAGILAVSLVAVTVVLPLATPSMNEVVAIHRAAPWVKPSGIHRLLIWRFAADRIAERPLLGWGMDASRELPEAHRSIAEVVPESDLPANALLLALHPHNAVLQWRLELGVPGVLLCLGIVLSGIARATGEAQASSLHRAMRLAWIASALVIALLSYGVWQAWWLSCLWLTAAVCRSVASVPNKDDPARPS